MAISRTCKSILYVIGIVLFTSAAGYSSDQPAEHMRSGEHQTNQGYHHSFGQAGVWAKEFDDPSRNAWQKPEQILDALNLGPTARVAYLGAGTGYFSVRIAKRVPEGKVFAIDIEPEMLRYLSERARREHLSTVIPVVANEETPNIPEPVDLILVVDTYHHIDDRIAYFNRLRKSLKPG
jgi:cyclopropane fatty-acyl-phospholipid synthase-like methyltransferase